MELRTEPPVDIALRTLQREERRSIDAWFDHLKNWDNDSHVRKISHQLPHKKNVFVLAASDGTRIFFRKEANTITVLDIARKETIDQFA